jgi:hypothetical protein
MSFEPMDLGPVGADADAERFEAMVAGVMRRARPELERRAAAQPVLGMLGRWVWPTLAAAAIATVASTVVLLYEAPSAVLPGTAFAQQGSGFAEMLPVWLAENRTPTSADMMMILEGDMP